MMNGSENQSTIFGVVINRTFSIASIILAQSFSSNEGDKLVRKLLNASILILAKDYRSSFFNS